MDPRQYEWMRDVFLEESDQDERASMIQDTIVRDAQNSLNLRRSLLDSHQGPAEKVPDLLLQIPAPLTAMQAEELLPSGTWSQLLVDRNPDSKEASDAAHQAGASDLVIVAKRGPTRRLHSRTKAFLRHWIARVRMHFPMRSDKPSDRAAMTKWLSGEMREHGIRITHIAQAIPMVVRLCLLPDVSDIAAQTAADVVRSRSRYGRACYRFRTWLAMVAAPPVRSAAEQF